MKRLLFVDDEPCWLSVLPKLLRDYDVVCACGGENALDVLRSGSDFDLIFCDVFMPGLGGLELFSIVAAELPEIKELFVFLSGDGGALAGKTNAVLEKPLPISELKQFLRHRLGECA